MTPTAEYVTRTPAGGLRITGSRVSLDSVIHAYWDGRLPEAIASDFPSLTLEQVHGAIAHYLRNRIEVDRYLLAQDGRWLTFQKESELKHSPLLRRMRQVAKTPMPAGDP